MRDGPGRIVWLSVLLSLVTGLSPGGRAAEVSVSTPAEITAVLALVQPGDTLVMQDGVWTNADILFSASGTATLPITLRAQTFGRVQLVGSSRLRLAGRFLVVEGLTFTNGYRASGEVIAFQDTTASTASFCRITNCAIVDYCPPDTLTDNRWVGLYGVSNRVDYCYFRGKTNAGTMLVVWVSDQPNYHVIAHNYFGFRPALNVNGGETIRVGTSDVSFNTSRTTVEDNYFERCSGDVEIISSKSVENIYRRNTFFECEGALTLRHGNGSVVEGNYFFGNRRPLTGGVRIIGEDHKIYNNYFQDLAGTSSRAPLALMQGLVNSPLNGYFQVFRATVAFNTFVNCTNSIIVGLNGTLTGTTNQTTLPPTDCVIANNLVLQSGGKMVDQRITPSNLLWEGNIFFGATLNIPTNGGIAQVNPQLARAADGLWRPKTNSPALGAARGTYSFVTNDFEGDARPVAKDVGGDQASFAARTYPPLSAANTGPLWMRARGVTFLSWAQPAAITYGTPLGAAQLNASANAAGTFAYDPPAGSFLNAGSNQTLTVVFTPADSASFNVATQTVTVSVLPATPEISWTNPPAIAYGTPLGAAQLNASASVPGSFSYDPFAGTLLNASNGQALTVVFTPDRSSNFLSVTRSVLIDVTKAVPVLAWNTPSAVEQGTALGAAQLNATASTPGTFAYTPPAGTVLPAGSGRQLAVSFTPDDTANFTPASRTTAINVTIGGKTLPTISWPAPAPILYGTPLSGLQLNATVSAPGTLAYTPPAGTVLPAGFGQTLTVTFLPDDPALYVRVTNTVSIDVAETSSNALVRVAYLVPTNRVAQAHAVTTLRSLVRLYQEWFADQMERNGYGRKTFTCETEPDGVTPFIHVLHLPETDRALGSDIYGGGVLDAARAAGLPVGAPGQVWWLIPETQRESPDGSITGGFAFGQYAPAGLTDSGWAMSGGEHLALYRGVFQTNAAPYDGFTLPEIGPYPLAQDVSFPWFEGTTLSGISSSAVGAGLRSLAEAFGLGPDYLNDENFNGNLMGFGFRGIRGTLYPRLYPYNYCGLSYASALPLSVSPFFNPNRPVTDTVPPTVVIATSGERPLVNGLLRISFSAGDNQALHGAVLTWETAAESVIVDELSLTGTNAAGTFAIPYFNSLETNRYTITIFDRQGNRRAVTTSIVPKASVNHSPQPFISALPVVAGLGQDIVLDASATFDPEHSVNLLEIEWDFDGDGLFDTAPSTDLVVTNNYYTLGTRLVRARITDPAGATAVSAPVPISIRVCLTTLSPLTRFHGFAGSSGDIEVTVGPKCIWQIVNTNDWVTIEAGLSGVGSGVVHYTVLPNPTFLERQGWLLIGDEWFLVKQHPIDCNYSLSPTNRFHGYGTGSNSFKVTTKVDCAWTVVNTNPWIRISGGSGTATGLVSYALSENRITGKRVGNLLVAGEVFTVTQWGTNCEVVLGANGRAHTELSETGSVSISTAGGCGWNVLNTNGWITLTSPVSGTNSGSFGYLVAANLSLTPRAGVIWISGQPYAVTQAACSYVITPTSRVHAYLAATGSVSVTAGGICAWTVENTNDWITITAHASGGTGKATVKYAVTENLTSHPRDATITVADHTFTVSQSGKPCLYTVTPEDASHPEGGGLGQATVHADPGCEWTVTGVPNWITIITPPAVGASGTGAVRYLVAANNGGGRSVTLTIAGQDFTVSQASAVRVITASDLVVGSAQTNCLLVTLDAHGGENSFGFSLCFDTNLLTFAGAQLSTGTLAGATLTVSNSPAGPGRVGFNVALAPGTALSAGAQLNLQACFRGAVVNGRPVTAISMCDLPVARHLADAFGRALPASFTPTSVGAQIIGLCTLADALDAPALGWTVTAGAWSCQTNVTHDGEGAAVSGVTPDGGENRLETTLVGPGELSFWWKVSSEPSKDRLRFYFDGIEQFAISGEVEWEARAFSVPAGSHNLRWRYSKNSSAAVGQDRGWVDQIVFAPALPAITGQPASQIADEGYAAVLNVVADGQPPLTYQWLFNGLAVTNGGGISGAQTAALTLTNLTPARAGAYSVVVGNAAGSIVSAVASLALTPTTTLPQALDATNLLWLTTGTPAWYGQTAVNHDGSDAARSGAIADNQTTTFETTVTGPGTASFWWKVSCETNNDRLVFFINGSEQARITGETDWAQLTFALGSGAQNLRWSYSKNSSLSAGLDRGWVDQVEFAPAPVTFTAQPVDLTLDPGATAGFTVTVSGTPPFAYQWRLNGTNLIEGATARGTATATLTLSNVTAARAGNYSVLVGNPAGGVESSNALLQVNQIVTIGEAVDAPGLVWTTNGTPPWVGQTLVTHDGADAARSGRIGDSQTNSFQTTVTGPGAVSFWWKVSSEAGKDFLRFFIGGVEQQNISGEADWTWRTFPVASGSQALEWRYTKNSSLAAGQDRGWVDQVLFVPNGAAVAPVIAIAPTNRTVVAPAGTIFTVAAAGSGPLSYQWFLNAVPLVNSNGVSGAATTNLTLATSGAAQAGDYTVVVTNSAGSATSVVATLTVITSPIIVTPPANQNLLAGTTANFSVGALGLAPLAYQWRFNGVNLTNTGGFSGVTTTNLRVSSVTATQAGAYSVVVTNPAGSITSAPATLVISVPPTIAGQPANQTAVAGNTATFSVGAGGSAPFTYQWRFTGADIPGATSATLARPNVQSSQAGTYSVVVANGVGSVTSSNATLAVLTPPVITLQPAPRSIAETLTTTFFASATGTAPLGYQWRRNGTNLADDAHFAGVNTATLLVSNALPAHSGAYSLQVSNAAGVAVSSNVPLNVIPATTLGEAVNAPYLAWNTSPEAPWIVQTNLSHDGDACAQSGGIAHSNRTWIEATITGPGTLRFWWKVSSQTNADTLTFAAGDSEWARTSGEAEWEKLSFNLPPGALTVRWTYTKNGSTNAGLDRAWLDEVDFLPANAPAVPVVVTQPVGQDAEPGETVTLSVGALGTAPLSYQWHFEGANLGDGGDVLGANSPTLRLFNVQGGRSGQYDVLVRNPYSVAWSERVLLNVLTTVSLPVALETDRTNLIWRTGGYSPWRGQEAVSYDGFDAAQSGPVPHGGSNWLQTVIRGPITLAFWWKVSSETNQDFVRFVVDGAEVTKISGETDWRQYAFPILSNSATVRWEYTKDAAGSAGLDRAWVDRLEFLAISPLITNAAPDTNIVDQGTTVDFKIDSSGTLPINYQWRYTPTLSAGAVITNLPESTAYAGARTLHRLTITNAQPGQSGYYTCQVANDAGVDISQNLYLRVNPALPIGPAVNATNLVWETGGFSWFVGTTDNSHNDNQAARNGYVRDGCSTWTRTSINGPGTLRFWWSASTQPGVDVFRFSSNGVVLAQISGNQKWVQQTVVLPAGPTLVKWEYAKDAALTNGSDRVWLDDVSFTPTPPSFVAHPAPQTVDSGTTVTFTSAVTGGPPFSYRWRSNGVPLLDGGNISGATTPTLRLAGVLTTQAATYSLVASNVSGTATSSNAVLAVTQVLPLADALDAPNFAWATGTPPWIGQPVVTHDLIDAARSPALGDNQSASAQTTITGPGTVSFWWKVSSETNGDALIFYVGNNEQARLSGEVNWQQRTFGIPAGDQTVKWTYAKNASVAAGQDRGWVDQFVFIPLAPVMLTQPISQNVEAGTRVTFTALADGTAPLLYQWLYNGAALTNGGGVGGARTPMLVITNAQPARTGNYSLLVSNTTTSVTSLPVALTVTPLVSLSAALDGTNLVWTTNTAAPWVGQMIVTHDGTDAARSGALADNGSNYIQTVITGPGTMSFWWKVSSEPVNDILVFTANNVEQARISGEAEWTFKMFTLGSGSQTCRWAYLKNATAAGGQDRAWVDEVLFGPVPPMIVSAPTNQNADVGGMAGFRVVAGGTPPFTYQWQFDNVNLTNGGGVSGATSANLTLTGVQLAQAGAYRVVVSSAAGTTPSPAAALAVFPNLTLAAALDTTGLPWTTNGSPAWVGHGAVTHDGVDAARSPLLPDNGIAWMETSVTGPGTVSFWWKVSSESGSDRLRFYLDGSEQQNISGEVDWQFKSYNLGSGIHALRWSYTKNSSLAAGQDRGWVDQVSFGIVPPTITAQPSGLLVSAGGSATFTVAVAATPPLFYRWLFNGLPLSDGGGISGSTNAALTIASAQLGQVGNYSVLVSNIAGSVASTNALLTLIPSLALDEVLDNPGLVFTTGGTAAPWAGEADVTHDGVDAALSGPASDSTYSWIKATVNGSNTLTFWWKVSSEPGHDYLRFMVDGTDVVRISGEVDWQQITYNVPAGSHELQWRFSKNGSGASGQDRGWLDQVTFGANTNGPPVVVINPPVILIQPASQTVDEGATVSLNVAATGPAPLSYQWFFSGTNLTNAIIDGGNVGGATTAELTIFSVLESQRGNYSVVVTNVGGAVTSLLARLTVNHILDLAEAIDVPDYFVTTSGDARWEGNVVVTHDGQHAARSGLVGNGQSSSLQLVARGPGTANFWWRVSSETNADVLVFSLNGQPQDFISGEADWTQRAVTLPAGPQFLEWTYFKDGSGAAGADRAWVDQFFFLPSSGLVAVPKRVVTAAMHPVLSLADNRAQLKWPASARRTYEIYFKDNLSDPEWQRLDSEVLVQWNVVNDAIQPDTYTAIVEDLPGGQSRFYRVLEY